MSKYAGPYFPHSDLIRRDTPNARNYGPYENTVSSVKRLLAKQGRVLKRE